MEEITLKKAEIEKVRDRINQYIGDLVIGTDMEVDAVKHTIHEYFNDLTGDTQPIDLEKPCPGLDPSDDDSLRVGDPCPNLSCGGRLGSTVEDGLTCPECGLSFGTKST